MKKKKILLVYALFVALTCVMLIFFPRWRTKTDNETGKLNFDYGLTNRLGENYIIGEPENVLFDDYDRNAITSSLGGREDITFFLPNNITFSSVSLFTFFEYRHSIDIVKKTVHELYAEFYFSSVEECEKVWQSSRELTKEYHGYPVLIDDLFNYSAIVFKYNWSTEFQYILRTGDKRIAFISFDSIESVSNLSFDKSYQPTRSLYESSFPRELIKFGGFSY